MKNKRTAKTSRVAAWIVGASILVIGVYLQINWMAAQEGDLASKVARRFQEIPCYQCGGEGYRRNPNNPNVMDYCSICFGVGKREFLSTESQKRICRVCVGMGRTVTGYNSGTNCTACSGWGVIGITTWKEAEIVAHTMEDLPTEPRPPPTMTPLPPPSID